MGRSAAPPLAAGRVDPARLNRRSQIDPNYLKTYCVLIEGTIAMSDDTRLLRFGEAIIKLAGSDASDDCIEDEVLVRAWVFHQLADAAPVVAALFDFD